MIVGRKVLLRAIEPHDVRRLWEWGRDGESARLRDYPAPPVSLESARRGYEESLDGSGDRLHLAVCARDGRLIGEASLTRIDQRVGDAELTIAIGDKDYWGHGYGSDATLVLCEYGFYQLNLHRVTLYVHDFNERAIRAYRKCGFREEGRLREAEYMDGGYSDILIMGLLRSELAAHTGGV